MLHQTSNTYSTRPCHRPFVCTHRCVFLPIDSRAGHAQLAKVLQHAQPCLLIWATPDTQGGAGPVNSPVLPAGCHAIQMQNASESERSPAKAIVSSNEAPDNSDGDKPVFEHVHAEHVQQQLATEFAAWQTITAESPKLPFCCVMYTSGSTGTPAGVRGTEAGAVHALHKVLQSTRHFQPLLPQHQKVPLILK